MGPPNPCKLFTSVFVFIRRQLFANLPSIKEEKLEYIQTDFVTLCMAFYQQVTKYTFAGRVIHIMFWNDRKQSSYLSMICRFFGPLVISEFHVWIFVQLVTDLFLHLRFAIRNEWKKHLGSPFRLSEDQQKIKSSAINILNTVCPWTCNSFLYLCIQGLTIIKNCPQGLAFWERKRPEILV